jgi:LytR cell envelope-related transcriptional attenuator
MDHPLRLEQSEIVVRPWRLAVLALAGVAAVELVLLVVAGGALLARADAALPGGAKQVATERTATTKAKATKASAKAAGTTAILARRKVGLVVLNGNGRQGAAAGLASRASGRGYRIRAVANAPSMDYPRSIVMYRPGFAPEGHRLARDLGVPLVSPLDGMRPKQLHGAHVVVILGG